MFCLPEEPKKLHLSLSLPSSLKACFFHLSLKSERMSKDDFNLLKTQTCVLKVHIHCDGCKKKVKKLLQKIDGVYTINIDADHGRVSVTGNVDPATLVKKLCKAGKHAELLQTKAAGGGGGGGNNPLSNQFQKLQMDAGGKKPPKGGGGKDQKGQQQQQQQQQQQMMKDMKLPQAGSFPQLKDMKMPPLQKEQKSVKFSQLPPEEMDDGSDFDDEFDDDDGGFDDDGDFDDMDGFDDDLDELPKQSKSKPKGGMGGALPANIQAMLDKIKGGGAGKKGGGGGGAAGDGGQIPVQIKGMGGDGGNNGGKKGAAAGDGKNGGDGGKNGGKGGAPNGKKGGGGGKANPMGNANAMMMGGMQAPHPMAGIAAVQGLPAGGPPPGYYHGMVAAPPQAAANAYQQQQYMAAMMQQRAAMMNGGGGGGGGGGYGGYYRAPPPMQAPPGEPIGEYFSDENANGCSVM